MGEPQAVRCVANKTLHGLVLRCTRPHKHEGNHRWAEDKEFYPFGRLDPDDPFDQMFVKAFNDGVKKRRAMNGRTGA